LPDMIHGSVVASKPKTMQETVEIATELMDKKIRTFAERETANKMKFENTSRSTQNQQQQLNKRQNTARDALRSTNGDDSHNSGMGVRRTKRATRECTYTDFLKYQP
nr:hypothetical protein [Tanacetum cinerariifolium]